MFNTKTLKLAEYLAPLFKKSGGILEVKIDGVGIYVERDRGRLTIECGYYSVTDYQTKVPINEDNSITDTVKLAESLWRLIPLFSYDVKAQLKLVNDVVKEYGERKAAQTRVSGLL